MLGRDRHADQAAAMLRKEIDLLRRDEVRREHEVAFVLAVLIVDEHDDAAGLELGDDLGSGGERHGVAVRFRKERLYRANYDGAERHWIPASAGTTSSTTPPRRRVRTSVPCAHGTRV